MGELEIVTRRRRWRPEEKAALLAEVEAADGRVSMVARRHGISVSLLYNWRAALRAAASMGGAAAFEFVPIGTLGEGSAVAAREQERQLNGPQQARSGVIEIELRTGILVRVDALVDEPALSRVLRAVKGAS